MTQPRIQYARTNDGVNIAFAESGAGKPLLLMPSPGYSHTELNATVYGDAIGAGAEYRTVLYDARGTGLSDRDALDYSMEAMLADLEAVLDRVKFDSFVLAAWSHSVPVAITYAAANPERVTHLIFFDGYATSRDFVDTPAWRASAALLEVDWKLFTETLAEVMWAHSNPEFGRQMGAFMRACAEPDAGRAMWRAWETRDVTELLPRIAAPTLVIQNKGNRLTMLAAGQRIAAGIPGARFATTDDVTYRAAVEMAAEFLSEHQTADSTQLPSGTAIILFADIVDSTALTEQLGDTAFRERARQLDDAMRAAIREANGTTVEGKLLGDGVFGGAVNIAARIAAASAPGEILVSDTVRSLARTSAGARFEDRGQQALKGIDEPHHLFAVVVA